MKSKLLLSILLAGTVLGVVCGCNGGGPDATKEGARLDSAQTMRKIFNETPDQDYSKINGLEKATFLKLAGSEEKAQKAWNQLKYGPSGTPPPPGTTPTLRPPAGSAAAAGHP